MTTCVWYLCGDHRKSLHVAQIPMQRFINNYTIKLILCMNYVSAWRTNKTMMIPVIMQHSYAKCVLRMIHTILIVIVYYILHTTYYILHTTYCIQHIVHSTSYRIHYTLYSIQYKINYTLYTILYTLYSIHCKCTLYSVQYSTTVLLRIFFLYNFCSILHSKMLKDSITIRLYITTLNFKAHKKTALIRMTKELQQSTW